MRTFDGYKKRSLDSKKVLLADGSHTDVVIGKIEWDSDNRTLKWTKVGDSTSTSVLFGSNAFSNDSHSYLPLSGGTLSGSITFNTIATWPTISGETYPIKSSGLYWSGSSDTAEIYYEVAGSDAGRLVLNTGDDANCTISFRNRGIEYAYVDTSGLHVEGSAFVNNGIITAYNTSDAVVHFAGINNVSYSYLIYNNSDCGSGIKFKSSLSDSTPIVFDYAGNVGIGTTNPTYKLDVNGQGRFASGITAYDNMAAHALLHSGAGRPDSAVGDTWIFVDDLDLGNWGIKHDQPGNNIDFYGLGKIKFHIPLYTDDAYSTNNFKAPLFIVNNSGTCNNLIKTTNSNYSDLLGINDNSGAGGAYIGQNDYWIRTGNASEQPKVLRNGTAYTLWHAGNDGSGSGLDADLLDGYQYNNLPYLPTSGAFITGSNIADMKVNIRNYFNGKPAGTNCFVGSPNIGNFWNDSAECSSTSVCGIMALNPGYDNYNHGHFLVSHYGDNRIGMIGLGYTTWYGPYWFAYTSDIPTRTSQLTNDSGYLTSHLSLSHLLPKSGDLYIFNTTDIPEGATNLANTATAHKINFYRNGFTIPYQMDNSNDGGMFRVRGTSESNCIAEIATWDDSGDGETIQFNYYPTTSLVTPTYSISVPKKSGTIALTSDIPTSLPANGGTSTYTYGLYGRGYTSGNSNLIKAFWNTKGDNRWYFQSEDQAYQCRVDYATTAGSASASDVSAWAKASSKPSYNFGEISTGNITMGDGANYFLYRTDDARAEGSKVLRSGFYFHTTGRESVVFANQYAHTGWIFANGVDPVARKAWNALGVTPALQIHHNAIYVNRAVRDADSADYNLYVNGTANITGTITQNGTAVSLSGHTHDYMPWNNVSSLDANSVNPGWYNVAAGISNAAHTNHSSLLYVNNVGTPYLLQIPDSSEMYIYKRYYSGGSWSTWSKISAGYADSAGSAPANGGNSDTVDGYHAYNIDEAFNRTKVLDLRGLDENTFYPCYIGLSTGQYYKFNIWTTLDGYNSPGSPSWCTHSSGIVFELVYEVTGYGWGTQEMLRKIHNFYYAYCSKNPFGGLGQLTNPSVEFIYLRGGARYLYHITGDNALTIATSYISWYDSPYTQAILPITASNSGASAWDYASSSGIAASTFYGNATSATNADTLDGYHYNNLPYLTSHQDISGKFDKSGGDITPGSRSNWGEGIRIHSASNGWTTLALCGTDNTSGGGTSANTWSFHAYGGNFYLTRNGSDNDTVAHLWCVSNAWDFKGSVTSNSSFYSNSDIRYKSIKNYLNITSEMLALLPIFNYVWTNKEDKLLHTGSSALAVEQILPNLVTEDSTGLKSLDYAILGTIEGIVCARELVEAKRLIQELRLEINKLKTQLNYGES